MHIVAVIDTNVWVSAFLNPEGFPARLINSGKTGSFSIVASFPLLEELREVLLRPRILQLRQTTEAEVETFITSVAAISQMVPISGELKLCRDPNDDLFLETALSGRATHIVSRDEDLTRDLEISKHLEEHGVKVVTVQNFLNLLP